MRLSIITIISALTIVSCGGPAANDDLSEMKAKRDSLKNLRSDLTAQIAELENQLALSDTNARLRVTSVTTLTTRPERFEHFFTIQGVVETDQNAQIFPEVGGKITSIRVKEGDRVSKGSVLMTLDSRIVNNQIDELESRLKLAETVFKKQERLWEQKVGSEIQYLEAKNNYESLQENLETLKSQRSLYTITAPFSGIVDEIMPKEGEMAAPQMPAIRLINNEHMYIKSDVTERYLGKIKEGDSVEVFFPSIGQREHSQITRIGEFINPNNRTFKIKVKLNNETEALKPNLLGELTIRDYVADSTVVIPVSLVQMTPTGESFVYTVDGEQAKKVMIETGMTQNDLVEITAGLSGGEVLIDKGARAIKEGDVIRIDQ